MIETDISNVWGAIDFRSFIQIEERLMQAHNRLVAEEEKIEGWYRIPVTSDEKQLDEISRAAKRVRSTSSAMVVIGDEESCAASRAAIEFLNGIYSCMDYPVRIFYAGSHFSTRALNEILEKVQNLDFSVFIVSQENYRLETAAAFRVFRWALNRKYGPEKSNSHIYAATDPRKGKLYAMAVEEGWTSFELPPTIPEQYLSLTVASLFPMAVAGIDVRVVLAGARQIRTLLMDRGMDNPAWLYSGVRAVLYENGRHMENICSAEPHFGSLGQWWCRLIASSGAKNGHGILPISSCYPADLASVGQMVSFGEQTIFETCLTFENHQNELKLELEWKNTDDLNFLAGKSIDFLREQSTEEYLAARMEAGIPVILLKCGRIDARTIGQLIYFFQFTSVLSAYLLDSDPYDIPGECLRNHDRIANLRR